MLVATSPLSEMNLPMHADVVEYGSLRWVSLSPSPSLGIQLAAGCYVCRLVNAFMYVYFTREIYIYRERAGREIFKGVQSGCMCDVVVFLPEPPACLSPLIYLAPVSHQDSQ